VKANPSNVVPVSGRDPQSAYTPIVQKMKADNANFSLMTSAVSSALELRNEAALQGLNSSKIVWECVSCYGDSTVTSNASAFEGEYQFLGFLPFNETKYNPTLAAFIKYVGKHNADQFAAYSFDAVLAFVQAIKSVVAQHGVNGITRATTLEGIKSLTNFNAGGMAGAHSFKTGKTTPCFVMVQFKSGQWVRVYPTKPGTFDCTRPTGSTSRRICSGSSRDPRSTARVERHGGPPSPQWLPALRDGVVAVAEYPSAAAAVRKPVAAASSCG
jgi:Periplasmic binding protein